MRATIWLNARKRKGQKIHRHCDESYTIVKEGRHSSCPETAEWREELRYLSTSKGRIVETKNNIGHLRFGADCVQNTLLQMKRNELKEIPFEQVQFTLNEK